MTLRRYAYLLVLFLLTPTVMADEVFLYAAGSLRAALGEIADKFESSSGHSVTRTFAPSGLLRERIEQGEPAQVFASANMKHPRTLHEAGKAGEVTMFARNQLCALAQEGVTVNTDTLLDVMLDANIRVGTSTPKADPSGDYAWQLFEKAESLHAGAFETLDGKALKLTGGKGTEKAPEGRNQYGWVMASGKADVFLTYCTNAILARKEVPALQVIPVPGPLSVGASYGITLIDGASAAAAGLRDYILSPEGQQVLASYGFDAPG